MNLCTGRQRGKNVAIKAGSCRGSEAENKAWWGGVGGHRAGWPGRLPGQGD